RGEGAAQRARHARRRRTVSRDDRGWTRAYGGAAPPARHFGRGCLQALRYLRLSTRSHPDDRGRAWTHGGRRRVRAGVGAAAAKIKGGEKGGGGGRRREATGRRMG